jgi:hypothetical protein
VRIGRGPKAAKPLRALTRREREAALDPSRDLGSVDLKDPTEGIPIASPKTVEERSVSNELHVHPKESGELWAGPKKSM